MTETPTIEKKPKLSLLEELALYWGRLPAKALFFGLAAGWVALFYFLGNSTFGYIDTQSLFGWMQYAYTHAPDDEHGFLIPLVVVMLLWWKRDELLASIRGVWWPALALLVFALLLHVASYMVQQTRISIFAFYFGFYALMGLVWGRRFLVASFFPMILFVFAVPLSTVSEAITYPLRVLVTKLSVGIGHGVLAMGIRQDGSQILSETGVAMYDVAPACSGIRSLTALGAVTLIYAFTAFRADWRRLVVLLAAFPMAVAGNTARVTTLLILGDVFGKDQAMKLEQYLGLVTFAVALGCLFILGRWLQSKGAQPPESELKAEPAAPVVWQGASPWPSAAVVLLMLASAAVFLNRVAAGHHLGTPGLKLAEKAQGLPVPKEERMQAVRLPLEVDDFNSEAMEITPLEMSWLPQDTLFGRRKYISGRDNFWAQLSVVLMGTDRTSIHKPQYCLEGQGWRIEKSETISIPMSKPYPYDLQAMKLTASGKVYENGSFSPAKAIYVYWFVADNELTPYHGERMWWMARDLIRSGVLQRWAYVSYFTACRPGFEEPTTARLKELIAASVPEFQLAAGSRRTMESTAVSLTESSAGAKN